MKKIVLYFLLMSFVFQSASNLWIISSFYINQNYIAKNLCVNRFDKIPICYGKCFLDKQLKDNDKEEQKIPNVKEKEIQLYFYHQKPVVFYQENSIERSKAILFKKGCNIINTFFYSIFHPPKMA